MVDYGHSVSGKKVLVACEFSGIVRDAFIDAGFNAISCDLRETEKSGPHVQGDILELIDERGHEFDLMIAHPPCTYLANSGVVWLYRKDERWKDLIDGAVFFRKLYNSDIPRIAVENPVIHKYAKQIIGCGDPTQTFQPWHFGHLEKKRICLWLKNLPELEPTEIVKDKVEELPEKEAQKKNYLPPGEDRAKERSRFFEGVAEAMADQWGDVLRG